MADKILIVDDDEAVLTMLAKVMKSNGFEADPVGSGEEALKSLKAGGYSLVLLDINMHGIDGFEVLERMRRQGDNTPVIIVTARKEDYDALYGLDIGADDYIIKPFNPVTLGAKVKALIRRAKGTKGDAEIIHAGPFSYNTSTLRLTKNDVEIPLTGKENSLMKLFLDNVGRVFSKDILYELVWGNAVVDDNAVMVYINHLRQKIEDDPENPRYIQNVRGIGYRFVL